MRKWLSAERSSGTLNALSIRAHRLFGIGFPRDIETLHERLYSRGLAVPFGRPFLALRHGYGNEIEEISWLIRGLLPAQAKLAAPVLLGAENGNFTLLHADKEAPARSRRP
jgi:hypothetical protein